MCDIIFGRSSDLVHSFMSLDKDRELVEAQAEVKALKLSERLKTKAVEELADQLEKVDEKLKSMEILLENKVWNCISTPSLRVLCCAAQGLLLVCTSLCLHRHSYSDL
jgi:hypothetical protein